MESIKKNIDSYNKYNEIDKDIYKIEDKIDIKLDKEKKKIIDYECYHKQANDYLNIIIENLNSN